MQHPSNDRETLGPIRLCIVAVHADVEARLRRLHPLWRNVQLPLLCFLIPYAGAFFVHALDPPDHARQYHDGLFTMNMFFMFAFLACAGWAFFRNRRIEVHLCASGLYLEHGNMRRRIRFEQIKSVERGVLQNLRLQSLERYLPGMHRLAVERRRSLLAIVLSTGETICVPYFFTVLGDDAERFWTHLGETLPGQKIVDNSPRFAID